MTSIDTCQILLERYVLSSNMTYLQVLFESYLCYAVSSASLTPFPLLAKPTHP